MNCCADKVEASLKKQVLDRPEVQAENVRGSTRESKNNDKIWWSVGGLVIGIILASVFMLTYSWDGGVFGAGHDELCGPTGCSLRDEMMY